MDLKILDKPSIPKNDAEIVDKKRITPKQAQYIAHMCDTISEFLREQPLAFTEVRASRLIETLRPGYLAIQALKRQHQLIYEALVDQLDDEEDEMGYGDFQDEF